MGEAVDGIQGPGVGGEDVCVRQSGGTLTLVLGAFDLEPCLGLLLPARVNNEDRLDMSRDLAACPVVQVVGGSHKEARRDKLDSVRRVNVPKRGCSRKEK